MIVDDNEDSAELISLLLASAGHLTRVAANAKIALSVALEFCPDTALLDIGLPGIDGYELAVLLRDEGRLAQCRFIAVTGFSGEEFLTLSREAGFETHLTKPIDRDVLLRAVAGDTSDACRSSPSSS